MKSILYILLYALFNVTGAAFIKYQLRSKDLNSFQEWMSFIFNLPFISSFLLIILSALALFKALSTNSFSLIIPMATGVNFIFTISIGYYLFHDRLSMLSFLGILLIISGIFILSLQNYIHEQ